MTVLRSIEEIDFNDRSVVTVGTFDGVHKAHQEILREVVRRAPEAGGRSVVVTFEPHPKEIVEGVTPPLLLSTLEERIARLAAQQIDVLAVIPFTTEFSQLSSREFYVRYILKQIGVHSVVVGYDHAFGHNREGGIAELETLGEEFGFSVFCVDPVMVEGSAVSSSRIRRVLGAGDVQLAEKLLGYPYIVSGTIVQGDGRGRELGYPTANVSIHSRKKMIPLGGVYVAGAVYKGERYEGMLNIGTRPTVTKDRDQTVEIHLFDVTETMYGNEITLTFYKRLRDEKKFGSVNDLVQQLAKDKEDSKQFFSSIRNDYTITRHH
jgi:riboflavin kinase / FMN adenylyltransferase